MRADWKLHVEIARSCVVVMQQCEIHTFTSLPVGLGWFFYESGVLNEEKVENPVLEELTPKSQQLIKEQWKRGHLLGCQPCRQKQLNMH